jgi:hypothetical protein
MTRKQTVSNQGFLSAAARIVGGTLGRLAATTGLETPDVPKPRASRARPVPRKKTVSVKKKAAKKQTAAKKRTSAEK